MGLVIDLEDFSHDPHRELQTDINEIVLIFLPHVLTNLHQVHSLVQSTPILFAQKTLLPHRILSKPIVFDQSLKIHALIYLPIWSFQTNTGNPIIDLPKMRTKFLHIKIAPSFYVKKQLTLDNNPTLVHNQQRSRYINTFDLIRFIISIKYKFIICVSLDDQLLGVGQFLQELLVDFQQVVFLLLEFGVVGQVQFVADFLLLHLWMICGLVWAWVCEFVIIIICG